MFRKLKDVVKSQFPVSQPGGAPSIQSPESYEDFIEHLQALFEGEDAEAFFEAIENAPLRWQRKPEILLSKATGLLRAGEEDEARNILDEIERTHPKFAPVHYYRARLYILNLYLAHALRTINKVRNLAVLDGEAESDLTEMENIATAEIKASAASLGVSYEKMEKASWHNETAQEKMNAGQWQSAEQNAREAARLIPTWVSPRNNHSYILYFMGRIKEAFEEASAVLNLDPQNFHALKNLVIFHTGLGEDEQARQYSAKAASLLQALLPDSVEADTVIAILGLVNDHETLWALAQKYLKSDYDDLFDTSWYALGIAALHQGRLKEARKLLEKAEPYYEPAQDLAIKIRKSLKAEKPAPTPPDYTEVGLLLSPAILQELIAIISKHKGDSDLPPHLQKKLNEFIQKRPFIITGLFRLLTGSAMESVPHILLSLNDPSVDARLLDFALGSAGMNNQRMSVLMAMSEFGRKIPNSPIRFWDDTAKEWIETEYYAQMLSDDVELNISPAAMIWAEKAQNAKNVDEKTSLWRKAVETDPESGYAVHMLGIILMQNGQREEGWRLARRAIEVDPDYMFAYANLALMEAQEENPDFEIIEEYSSKLSKAPIITTQTAFMTHYVSMLLAFERKDFEAARKEFEIAADLRPDDSMLEGWNMRLTLGETFSGNWLEKFQADSRKRAHTRAMRTNLDADSNSQVTLNSLTREVLNTTARIWGASTYGKKAELIENISKKMQDAQSVKHVLDKLSNDERSALQWVLENHGSLALKEFADKYGDDFEESPYWNYHEPKTIMGRLRQTGLLAKGTLNNEPVVFMPADVRNILNSI